MRLGAVFALLLFTTHRLAAQTAVASVRFGVALEQMRREPPGAAQLLRGAAYGGELRVGIGNFFIGGGYAEGRLSPSGSNIGGRDLVEGSLEAGIRPFPGVEFGFGPFVRTLATDSASERWVVWRLGGRGEVPLYGDRVTCTLAFWEGVAARTEPVGATGSSTGGAAGVAYRFPGGRYALRLTYQVDEAPGGPAGSLAANEVAAEFQLTP